MQPVKYVEYANLQKICKKICKLCNLCKPCHQYAKHVQENSLMPAVAATWAGSESKLLTWKQQEPQ